MTLREWLHRLWSTVRRSRTDRDLEDELQAHLELAADEERRRGTSNEAALRAAKLRFGAVVQATEAQRDQRGLLWLEDLVRDLRFAARMLARNPVFTLVSVVSLAIGIGANCAVFSFADALLLRPLAVPRPAEVVTVGSSSPPLQRMLVASYPDYLDIRNRTRSFDGLVAFTECSAALAVTTGTLPKPAIGLLVSGNFFPVLEVEPEWGRGFRPDEDLVPGRDPVVIIGHELWERQFGADPAILGRTVRLSGVEFTVIGVVPRGFTGLDRYTRYEFYAPLAMWPRLASDRASRPLEMRDFRRLTIKGRLAPDTTLAQARTELSVIAHDLERAYQDTNRNTSLTVRTEFEDRLAGSPPNAMLIAMLSLLAAAVLFVACANVAGLLASRAPLRAREIAVRLAIGAGPGRVTRQLMTESVLVAAIGSVLGLAVGYAGVLLFRQFRIPTDLPISVAFELDQRALAVSLVVALVSAVLFGLAPALRAARADLTVVIKATDAAGFGRRRWGRPVLVAGQVAVSVILLAVAVFVHRDFQRRIDEGPGFPTDHLLEMWFTPGIVQYNEAQTQHFFEQVVDRARNMPGATSATLTSFVPMDGGNGSGLARIVPEAFQLPAGTESVALFSAAVDEQFFATLKLPILKGRAFQVTDSADAPRVAIVNDQAAARFWPGQEPLGKRFRLNDARGPVVEVVGLTSTTKYSFLLEGPTEFIYFPLRQRPQPTLALVIASKGDPAMMAAPLREVVRNLDPNQPISNLRPLDETYRMRSVTILNVLAGLIAAMGTMGMALAIIGLYGLVSYAAGRRTKEIGIRIAIGAEPFDVLRMVLSQGAALAVAGLAVGLLASVGVDHALGTMFRREDRQLDVTAVALVAVVVMSVTLLAAYLPARRASRINPVDALRCD